MAVTARTPKAVQRDVRSKDKYALILRAATRVFARRGFFLSKVADVAREAGVADGTVYLYFKNKEHLLVSIFEEFMTEAIVEGRAAVFVLLIRNPIISPFDDWSRNRNE